MVMLIGARCMRFVEELVGGGRWVAHNSERCQCGKRGEDWPRLRMASDPKDEY